MCERKAERSLRRVCLPAATLLLLCAMPAAAHRVTALDFPDRALTELAELRDGTTLAGWMRAHPDDKLVLYSHRLWDIGGKWIARAELKGELTDGRKFSRRAFFYAPDPPVNFLLPKHINPQTLRGHSRLGCIWIETNGVSEDDAERTRARLSQKLSGGQYDQKIWFANAGFWTRTAKWRTGSSTVVSAYESIGGATRPPRVLAFGFLPVSKLYVDLGGDTEDFWEQHFRTQRQRIDEAIALSGLAARDLKPINFLTETIDAYHAGESAAWNANTTNEVLSALKQWLDTTRPRGRRPFAAALLAADSVLSLLSSYINLEDDATRRQFSAIGARYDYAKLSGYMYTHNWLKQAYRLNRHGPVGALSFISMLERGFEFLPACRDNGYEGFRRMISAGEPFLRRLRNQKLRARVRLLVARAYSDIVALADGAGGGYVEASKYRREAARARQIALVHYRAALRLHRTPEERNTIWKAAWRLQAHVSPAGTNFFCVYD